MRRHKVDSQRERRLLCALVASKTFLGHAAKALDLDLIDAEHFRVVAKWCLDYHREYGEAPGRHVEDIYHKWSEDNANPELVESVKGFLEGLGKQHEEEGDLNIPYLLDELRAFMAKRKIIKLQETVEYAMGRGDVPEAENALADYRRVEVGSGAGFDPLHDEASWREAFAAAAKPIIHFDGAAGRFFNPALTRDALIGIQAPEKCGKTMWCVEFAIQALRRRRRVALFEVGDLSKSQIMLRLGIRWSGLPLWKRQVGKIRMPTKVVIDEAEEIGYRIETAPSTADRRVSYAAVQAGIRRFRRACGIADGKKYIMSSVHPTGTITVQGISAILDQWQQDHDYTADVIIIDYSDILAPEDPKKLPRDQQNDTWRALRRLSQERHALVISPTQANAQSYDMAPERVQTMRNFSEDKRKLAHCTGMLALNQSHAEAEIGGMRLNWVVLREAPFAPHRPLYVGTCFALGRALCCTAWPRAQRQEEKGGDDED